MTHWSTFCLKKKSKETDICSSLVQVLLFNAITNRWISVLFHCVKRIKWYIQTRNWLNWNIWVTCRKYTLIKSGSDLTFNAYEHYSLKVFKSFPLSFVLKLKITFITKSLEFEEIKFLITLYNKKTSNQRLTKLNFFTIKKNNNKIVFILFNLVSKSLLIEKINK